MAPKKKCQAAQRGGPVWGDGETRPNAAPGQPRADRYQNQAGEENCRDGEENQNPEVGVGGVPARVQCQNKQPGAAGNRYEGGAQHTEPVACEKSENGAVLAIGHRARLAHLVILTPVVTISVLNPWYR